MSDDGRYFPGPGSLDDTIRQGVSILDRPWEFDPSGETGEKLREAAIAAMVRGSPETGIVAAEADGFYEKIEDAMFTLCLARLVFRGKTDVRWDPKAKECIYKARDPK